MASNKLSTANNAPTRATPSKQYDLFTSFFGDPKDLSNTIELWDAIPKYSVSARRQNTLRDEQGRLGVYVHEFEYHGIALQNAVSCRVKIHPAAIEMEDGKYKQFYPSQSEEIIEEVLKKIFTDQRYGLHYVSEAESWVTFSLHMIRKELKTRGHTRSITEIKRSLEIMALAQIEVEMKGRGRGTVYTNPILTNVARRTREDLSDDPNAKWAAQLPALISKSVNDLAYRQYNYALHMEVLKTPLARWLHKRFIHRYRNASMVDSHHFLYTTIKRDSGLLEYARTNENVSALEQALQELCDALVLFNFEKEERRTGRRIDDVLYRVWATKEFRSEVKTASARLNKGREAIVGHGKGGR